jgi:hypothetical protein
VFIMDCFGKRSDRASIAKLSCTAGATVTAHYNQ